MSFFLAGSTAQEQIVDSFEDQDLSEYGGNTGKFTTHTSGGTIKDGSVGLKSDSVAGVIGSTSGLDNYPSQGDTFRCWVRGTTEGTADTQGIFFQYAKADETNTNNGYRVGINYSTNELQLYDPNGSPLGTQTFSSGPSLDTNYDIQIIWGTDDSHNISVFNESDTELASLSATDSDRTSGGIGFNGSSDGTTSTVEYWDYYRITS